MLTHLILASAIAAPGAAAGAPVAVQTDQTAALRCIGRSIAASPLPGVTVLVEDIDDTTSPVFNEERRLSMGGGFILRSALMQMETAKVRVALNPEAAGARALTLGGAWTQDDLQVRDRGAGMRLKLGEVEAQFGRRRGKDQVAGDFHLSRNGLLQHAVTVGAIAPRRGGEGMIAVDDGRDRVEIGYDARQSPSPQHTQRRILQVAAVTLMAEHFGIDPKACLNG